MRLELLSTSGAFLVPWAKQRLSILDAQRRSMGVLKLQKVFPINEFTVTIIAMEGLDTIRIEGDNPLRGFICGPRNNTHRGGWKEDGTPLEGYYIYPLIDDDGGSRTLTLDSSVWVEGADGDNYGNIDWIGINTAGEGEPSDAPVLTWKGPTGRTIPFDYTQPIEGLTTADISFGTTEFFTCFGPNIYSGGDILATLPMVGDIDPKVLGAAYTTYTKNDVENTVLICVVNNHYQDRLGFFDEVWVLYADGWEKIGVDIGGGRPTQCWFFNQSGNKCTRNEREITIDVANEIITAYDHDKGSGEYSGEIVINNTTSGTTPPEVNTGGYSGNVENSQEAVTTIKHKGSYTIYSDYKGDTRVTATLDIDDLSVKTIKTTRAEYYDDIPFYKEGEKPAFYIVGPDAYVPDAYSTVGAQGEVTFTIPANTCGIMTITATDECGNVATKNVRGPIGAWSTPVGGNNCAAGSTAYYTNGTTRRVIKMSFDGYGYSPTNGSKPDPSISFPYDFSSALDEPGVSIQCGSCGSHYITSVPGTYECGSGACYYTSGGGIQWTIALVKGCNAGLSTWICP